MDTHGMGQRVGPYELKETIGRGGMGAVYRAIDTRTGGEVALKLLPAEYADVPDRVARFLREGAAGMRLEHANVVRTMDVGEDAGTYYIAMERVRGQSLRAIMEHRSLGQREALSIALQIAEALGRAHARNIVHRDLKPSNVLIAADGVAKVMDFGLAKVTDASNVTVAGMLMGTAAYISPEQARGDETDARSDLYSLGVMLYEMLSGQLPFTAESTAALIFKHTHEEPLPVRRVNPELLPATDSLVWRLLHKQPEQRFQSAIELASALRICLDALDAGTSLPADLFDPTLPHGEALSTHQVPLVGRERELLALREHLQRATKGKGGLILINGEAGLGKTRLTQELQREARACGMLSLIGHCLYQEDPNPYLPFVEILQSYLDSRETVAVLAEQEEQDEIGSLIVRLSSFLSYTRGKAAPQASEDLGWADAQTAMFESIRQVLAALGCRQPLLLCVDDLQWASITTLRLLHYLARNVRNAPILLACTYRREELQEDAAAHAHPLVEILLRMSREELFKEITLVPLSRKQSDDLVRAVLPGVPENADFLQLVFRETEGNPFFIMEALRMWQEEGKLAYTETGWRLTASTEEMRVPQRVHDVIARRLERVDGAGREVLDVAAVMGRRFTVETISSALGLPRVELLRRLGRLEKKHQLILFDSGQYTFAHPVIRDVLYQELAEPLRVEYHLILARRLEELYAGRLEEVAYELAHHFSRGADYEPALRYALAATERAERQWALEEALHFNALALDALSELPPERRYRQQELATHQRRANLFQIAGDLDASAEELRQALSIAQALDETGQQAEVLTDLARVHARRGEWQSALDLAAQAMSLAEADGQSATIAQALSVRGMVLFQTGARQDALDSLRWALGLAETGAHGLLRARILGNIGNVLDATGHKEEAIEHYQQAIQVFEGEGRVLDSARGQLNLGYAYASMERMNEAATCYQSALAAFRTAGDVYHTALTHQHLAELELERGHTAAAADLCRTARDTFARTGDDLGLADTSRILGRIAIQAGDTEQAQEHLCHALEAYQELGDRPNWAETAGELARLLRLKGMVGQARSYLESAHKTYVELGLDKEARELARELHSSGQGVPMGGASPR